MPITSQSLNYEGSGAVLLSEILTKVNNAKDKPKKIEILQQNDSVSLRQILKGAFDPSIKWDLPEGIPPYKENDAPAGTEHTLLASETKRLWHFVTGADTKISKIKRTMFIQILEGLHADEAKLLVNVKDKSIKLKV